MRNAPDLKVITFYFWYCKRNTVYKYWSFRY